MLRKEKDAYSLPEIFGTVFVDASMIVVRNSAEKQIFDEDQPHLFCDFRPDKICPLSYVTGILSPVCPTMGITSKHGPPLTMDGEYSNHVLSIVSNNLLYINYTQRVQKN